MFALTFERQIISLTHVMLYPTTQRPIHTIQTAIRAHAHRRRFFSA